MCAVFPDIYSYIQRRKLIAQLARCRVTCDFSEIALRVSSDLQKKKIQFFFSIFQSTLNDALEVMKRDSKRFIFEGRCKLP